LGRDYSGVADTVVFANFANTFALLAVKLF